MFAYTTKDLKSVVILLKGSFVNILVQKSVNKEKLSRSSQYTYNLLAHNHSYSAICFISYKSLFHSLPVTAFNKLVLNKT